MLRVVIDTNIVVSALMSPRGNPAKILDMVADQKLRICYSPEILAEYTEVLARAHFNFSEDSRHGFIEGLKLLGLLCKPAESDIQLLDEDDRCFYDIAKSCDAILITGNTKHYPVEPFIVTPAEFLTLINNE